MITNGVEGGKGGMLTHKESESGLSHQDCRSGQFSENTGLLH